MEASIYGTIHHFVSVTKLHPILANFTAALVPVSVACDILAQRCKTEELRATAWWTLLFAAAITPFTALAGWFFWMKDDNEDPGMAIHKWLGIAFVVLLGGLFHWRKKFYTSKQAVPAAYLVTGVVLVIVLAYQAHLGGEHVFSE